MRLKTIAAFILAAGGCVGGAVATVDWIEAQSVEVVGAALVDGGHDWADVTADGLQVLLTGEAPDEATRFRVVSLVGTVIDPDRIVDHLDVQAFAAVEAPRFSIEILRNDDGISLIGLIPTEFDRTAVTGAIAALAGEAEVTDLLEVADFPQPETWDAAIDFALEALRGLPKSKISVSAERVEVTAISNSRDEQRRIESELARAAPDNIALSMAISAPRPVITPFTLRLTREDNIARFDACSAPDEASRDTILSAAVAAGMNERGSCRIGLGVPSPRWAEAVELAIAALAELPGGALTFSDADVTLVARDDTDQALFDRVAGELDAALPPVFSLHSILPEKISVDGTGSDDTLTPEFVATRSPEGLVQLRGRLNDDRIADMVRAYARAQFGSDEVYLATREDPELPDDWSLRVLAALNALGQLVQGVAVVQPDFVEIRGVSGLENVSEEVSRILADKLGEEANFEIDVSYDRLLDPLLNIPGPQECVDRINKILAVSKIAFEPSSSDITEAAGSTIDQIAEVAGDCVHVRMEIGGHTDSQGREVMNLELSQARAEAVLAALLERRIRVRNLTARGYGETEPVADNGSEDGRELNRRIEFRLVGAPEPGQDSDSSAAQPIAEGATPEESAAENEQN